MRPLSRHTPAKATHMLTRDAARAMPMCAAVGPRPPARPCPHARTHLGVVVGRGLRLQAALPRPAVGPALLVVARRRAPAADVVQGPHSGDAVNDVQLAARVGSRGAAAAAGPGFEA